VSYEEEDTCVPFLLARRCTAYVMYATHTPTSTCTHAHAHARARAHTHTHTHTHTTERERDRHANGHVIDTPYT